MQIRQGSSDHPIRPYLVVVDPQDVLYRYLEVARRKGFRTLVLAHDTQACRAGERAYNRMASGSNGTQIDVLVQCETGRAREIVRTLSPFASRVVGLLPGDDAYVPSTFAAGRAMGFDYAPAEDAVCQQSKSAMKRRLAECDVPTPRFQLARSLAEAMRYWAMFGGDCMVKMVDYCDSANVSRVTNREQLVDAWESITTNRLSLESPFPLAREALLEKVVEGRELSAEGYVQGDRVVFLNSCEKITSGNFIVIGHILPALLSPDEQDELEGVVARCVRALGIRNSVFHAEVHLRRGKAYVIECAARPPGQQIVDLIQSSRGYDLTDLAIDLAVGRTIEEHPGSARRHYAMLALFAEQSGLLADVSGLDRLRSRGGVQRVHLDVTRGSPVEALTTFRHRYGFVVLEDDTASGVREKAAWLRRNVRLEVSPSLGTGQTHVRSHGEVPCVARSRSPLVPG